MPSYQDVVLANQPVAAWAFTEAGGLDFIPYFGVQHLTGHNAFLYRQAGPFAASLAVVGTPDGYLTLPFPTNVNAPWWLEFWFRLSAAPPAADVSLSRSGNAAANGAGYYVAHSNGHIHFQVPTQRDLDTGFALDTNWHLIHYGHTDSTGVTLRLLVDGRFVHDGSLLGLVTPSPQTWGFGSDAVGTQIAPDASFSYAALYQGVLSVQNAYAVYVAASDPASGLNLSRGAVQALQQSTLDQILAAVYRPFPTA